MKTPQEWLAEQIGERPDDFALDELAAPLSWIANVQTDARRDLERVVRIAADFVKVCEEDGHARTMPAEFDSLTDALAALCKPGETALPTPAGDNPVAPDEGETPEGPQG